jgi:HEAT repeat protein
LLRLAATDSRQRQRAAEDLAQQATVRDQRLLLELFSDPDPLVREICLRGLQHIGGKTATGALVDLLADPELNVRAAVLKQLEEAPDAAMAPAVVKYLKEEKDPDLIVHGICFLRAAKGTESVKCLMSLLKHESWQVRAEAAVGIGKNDTDSNGFHVRLVSSSAAPGGEADAATKLQVEAYVALLDLLEDSDPFVVAKAVEGLTNADMAVAVEPLVKVAEKHPDLTASVLTMLAAGNSMRQKAIPHLRTFCKHQRPRIRAAAIAALCTATSDDVGDELAAALDEKESEVRIAAATALFKLLDASRQAASNKGFVRSGDVATFVLAGPSSLALNQGLTSKATELLGNLFKSARSPKPEAPAEKKQAKEAKADGKEKKPSDAKSDEDVNPQDRWLEDCYAGRRRPKWTSQLVAPLEKMLSSGDPKERVAAAVALAPLGKADAAVPILLETVRTNPDLTETATEVLPWLVWKQRLKMFHDLRSLAAKPDARARLTAVLSQSPDRRAAESMWELLADAKVTPDEARSLQTGLMAAYLGSHYYSSSEVSPGDRRDLAKAAKPRTGNGSDWQRLVALTLLAAAAPDEAAESAARLADDPSLGASLRTDAFQMQLVTKSGKEAKKLSLAALKGTDAARKKRAIKYLVHGPNELRMFGNGIYLNGAMDAAFESGRQSGMPIVPKPPEGVAAEDIRPLAGDSDLEVKACAGYLLALLGESDAVEPLVQYWRKNDGSSSQWRRLVYRAIAVVDDPRYIPVLREIYGKLDEYEVNEFYWTIRIMSGSEMLKLRKQIRDEKSKLLR